MKTTASLEMNKDGIFVDVNGALDQTAFVTWEDFISKEFEYVSLIDGTIVVDDLNGIDGVDKMLSLVDTLRSVADNIEETLRRNKICIRNDERFIKNAPRVPITFSTYMRGEY